MSAHLCCAQLGNGQAQGQTIFCRRIKTPQGWVRATDGQSEAEMAVEGWGPQQNGQMGSMRNRRPSNVVRRLHRVRNYCAKSQSLHSKISSTYPPLGRTCQRSSTDGRPPVEEASVLIVDPSRAEAAGSPMTCVGQDSIGDQPAASLNSNNSTTIISTLIHHTNTSICSRHNRIRRSSQRHQGRSNLAHQGGPGQEQHRRSHL